MTKKKLEFIERILKIFPMSQEEIQVFGERFEIQNFKKGEFLLREGDILNRVFFMMEGIVRQFKIVDGVDKSTFFYCENQMIRLLENNPMNPTSSYSLECLEDCTVCVAFSREDDMQFIQKHPRFESLCLILMDDLYKIAQENQDYYTQYSPEKRYLKFMEERPDLIQRVSQQHLASFLGFTAESLSRIRKRIHEKKAV